MPGVDHPLSLVDGVLRPAQVLTQVQLETEVGPFITPGNKNNVSIIHILLLYL